MDQELQHTNKSNSSEFNLADSDLLAKFDQDDFDLDFKPVTEGLGFKDKIKDQDNQDKKRREFIKKKALNRLNEKKSKVLKSEIPGQIKTERNINRGDLQAFYEQSNPQDFSLENLLGGESISNTNIATHKNLGEELEDFISKSKDVEESLSLEKELNQEELKTLISASPAMRGFAYLVDTIIVSCLWMITLLFFSFIARFDLRSLVQGQIDAQVLGMAGVLFLCFYFFYFTFMDSTQGSSIGKSLVNINVRTLDGKRAGVIRTFSRSLFTLLGFPLAGVPWLIGAQDKVSGTQVFNANDY